MTCLQSLQFRQGDHFCPFLPSWCPGASLAGFLAYFCLCFLPQMASNSASPVAGNARPIFIASSWSATASAFVFYFYLYFCLILVYLFLKLWFYFLCILFYFLLYLFLILICFSFFVTASVFAVGTAFVFAVGSTVTATSSAECSGAYSAKRSLEGSSSAWTDELELEESELEASVMTEPKAMTGLAKSDWSQNSYRYAYICQPGPLYVSEIQTVFGDHTCLLLSQNNLL